MTTRAHPNIKLYMAVFGALMFLTVVTVLVSYWHFPAPIAIAIGLAIATIKAALVAAFFMHLKGERALIYGLLGLTIFFVVVLFSLPLTDSVAVSDRMVHPPARQASSTAHP